jgi:cell division protein FtsB
MLQNEQGADDEPEGRRSAALYAARWAARAVREADPRPPLLSRVIVWVTGLICVLLVLATCGEAWTVAQLNQQVAAAQQTVHQLTHQQQQLQSSIQALQQPDTIEQEARRLGYVYPGDQPVVAITATPLPGSAGQAGSAGPTAAPSAPSSTFWGFWSDWLALFFGG